MMLKSFSIATNTVYKISIASSFNFGVLGSLAIGYEIQSGIHVAINGTEPAGWKHQIENTPVINYEVGLEK